MNIFEYDQKTAAETPFFVHWKGVDGRALYLPNADGSDNLDAPIGVEIVGAYSAPGIKFRNKKAARIVINQKKNGGKDLTEDELVRLVADSADVNEGEIADVCVGWRNFCDKDGPRKFNRDELRNLLRRNPVFAEQTEAAHNEAANFLGNGSER